MEETAAISSAPSCTTSEVTGNAISSSADPAAETDNVHSSSDSSKDAAKRAESVRVRRTAGSGISAGADVNE